MKSIKKKIKTILHRYDLIGDEGPRGPFYREKVKPIKTYKKNGFGLCEFVNSNPDKFFYVQKKKDTSIFSKINI